MSITRCAIQCHSLRGKIPLRKSSSASLPKQFYFKATGFLRGEGASAENILIKLDTVKVGHLNSHFPHPGDDPLMS